MIRADLAPPDPGLQPERTTLSWLRTSLATGVVALVLIRWAPHYGAAVLVPALLASLLCAALILGMRRGHHRRVIGVRAERIGPRTSRVALLTGLVTLLGVVGLAVVVAD